MGQLYDQLCSFENLYWAFRAARKGKRGLPHVARFEYGLEHELFQVQDELCSGAYQPGPYRSFYRTEAKRRLISAAPFRDRVVHHALVQVIEPLFDRRFIFDSYANRVGKGAHKALDRCTHFMRASRYVLPCDVRQFFPSIDHALLRDALARVIRDDQVLALADRILATGVGVLDEEYAMQWFPGDDLWAAARPRGLPLGNLTSQFWANVYLDAFDQHVKRDLKCRRYLRYVDDSLAFDDDKGRLNELRAAMLDFLARLRLTLHEESAQARPVAEGVTFLGFVVYADHRRLKADRGHAFRRRLWALARACNAGQIAADRVTASAQGWAAHAAHGDTHGLRRAVLGQVRLKQARKESA
jgi:retron-type reverse transcriptase